MDVGRVSRVVVVRNRNGLHARPAELIAAAAQGFSSDVAIVKDRLRINAKSILDVLTLGAVEGTSLVVETEGPDAAAAADAIVELVGRDFTAFEPSDAPPLAPRQSGGTQ